MIIPGVVAAGAVLLLHLLGCGGLPPANDVEPGGAVVVMVTEAATGAPLQVPVTVIVGGVRGVLDPAEEQLVLRNVPIGTGTPPTQPLTASARGYVTRAMQLQMSVTAATWVEVSLHRADLATTGTVEGTVTRAGDAAPIRNAFLRFDRFEALPDPGDDDDLTDAVGGFTDSDGRFIIGGIPVGDLRLAVQAGGFLPFEDSIVIRPDDNDGNPDLHVELVAGDATVNVPGVVVDMLTRLPIEGAVVSIADGDPIITGSTGRFTAPDVPVGEQAVVVTADDYDDFSATFNILPGMDRITVELLERADDPPPSPFTIGGTVTLAGRADNAGATVAAVLVETGETLGTFTTGPTGRYGLFVPPGIYELTVRFEGRSLSRDITVPEGGVVVDDVDFMLTVE